MDLRINLFHISVAYAACNAAGSRRENRKLYHVLTDAQVITLGFQKSSEKCRYGISCFSGLDGLGGNP